MHSRSLTALAGALALAGCSSMLTPAPAARELPGPTAGAIARDQGMSMVAKAGTWKGDPSNLAQRLTPMWVTLTNNSAVPVLVRYNELMLVTAEGRAYKALPPFRIDGEVTDRATAMYPPRGFAYAPHVARYMAGSTAYPQTLPALGPAYWQRYGTALSRVDLPTIDMLRQALPAGVLEPGGHVEGFVYFPGIDGDVDKVRLRADLLNAITGTRLVSLAIPFTVG